jgi:hypothetical protein
VPRAKRFKRASKGSKPTTWKTDKKGTVRIRISLADPDDAKAFLPGNKTKQISVSNATVTAVEEKIEKALFGKKQ